MIMWPWFQPRDLCYELGHDAGEPAEETETHELQDFDEVTAHYSRTRCKRCGHLLEETWIKTDW